MTAADAARPAPQSLRETAAAIIDPEARFATWIDGTRIGATWQATHVMPRTDAVLGLVTPVLDMAKELAEYAAAGTDPLAREKAWKLLSGLQGLGYDVGNLFTKMLTDFGTDQTREPQSQLAADDAGMLAQALGKGPCP